MDRRPVRALHRPPERDRRSPSPVPARYRLLKTARRARPSEPILVPKLRIQFADFPYLHCSIDQRLFTLETCCGLRYGEGGKSPNLPRLFKARPVRSGHRGRRGALRDRSFNAPSPYLRANRFQGGRPLKRKENSSRGTGRGRLVRLRRRLRPRPKPRPISPASFRNLNRIPFRQTGVYIYI